jgi:hypothetical protein
MRALRFLVVGFGVAASLIIGFLVDRTSHSVSDTLYAAAAPVALTWLAVAVLLVALRRRTA